MVPTAFICILLFFDVGMARALVHLSPQGRERDVRRGDQEAVTSPPACPWTLQGCQLDGVSPHPSGLACGCPLDPGLSAASLAALLISKSF